LFGKLFKKPSSNVEDQATKQLRSCMVELSQAFTGQHRKLDQALKTFKQMVKVGSTVEELNQQVVTITNTLETLRASEEALLAAKQLEKVSASNLIAEFFNHELSADLKRNLASFKASLDDEATAKSIIGDLVGIFTQSLTDQSEEIASAPASDEDLKIIIAPLLGLFNQLELAPKQHSEFTKLKSKVEQVDNLNDLCTLLESTSQLVLSTLVGRTDHFESFLKQLKERLDKFNQGISSTISTNQAIADNSGEFSSKLNSQVQDIQSSMTDVKDIIQLESLITDSLDSIIERVAEFDEKRASLEVQSNDVISDLEHQLAQAKSETDKLRDDLQNQRLKALTDHLTQVANRQAFDERMQLEFQRYKRYQKPLTLVIGDIDFFKKVNDSYGHVAGDAVITNVSKLLSQSIRDTDFLARFGGEEFVILLPETNLVDATKAINKTRLLIQNHKLAYDQHQIAVTMSFGVATFAAKDEPTDVLKRADKALYRAKEKGRNQVCPERNKSK
jgi:diguanylate cyclase